MKQEQERYFKIELYSNAQDIWLVEKRESQPNEYHALEYQMSPVNFATLVQVEKK